MTGVKLTWTGFYIGLLLNQWIPQAVLIGAIVAGIGIAMQWFNK